jgi:hypothetical protein
MASNGCGNDGGNCAICMPGRTCIQGSYCSCAAAGECPPGLACDPLSGQCQTQCENALCNGCCDQGFNVGTCYAGTSATQCRSGGHTCLSCACPTPACVPVDPNPMAGGGGACGCSTDTECAASCGGQNQGRCQNDSCL